MRELVVRNGTVVDETGADRRPADVAVDATTAIAHGTRDRTRGRRLPLEAVVHQQTQRTAHHVGWTDRGAVDHGERTGPRQLRLQPHRAAG